MIDTFVKIRTALKHIIPWDEDEIRNDLEKDYVNLEKDKKNYLMKNGFTLKNVEEKIISILDVNLYKNDFKKAKIIIDENYQVKIDMYFYTEKDNNWKKSVIEFENSIVLSSEDDEKLKNAPPLEIDFTL
jgi:hypothetical protein